MWAVSCISQPVNRHQKQFRSERNLMQQRVCRFWTIEADRYDAQDAKMKQNQTVMIKHLVKEIVIKDKFTFWTEAKEELDRYTTAMSTIMPLHDIIYQINLYCRKLIKV